MLKIGHEVSYPGKNLGDSPITLRVAEELETVPGIPMNQREVDWYSREYPLESMRIMEKPSEEWANLFRDWEPEVREIRKAHVKLVAPLMKECLASGDLEPTGKPTGEDLTQLIKDKARELGALEVGITAYDNRYTFQSRKDQLRYEHVICLGYEQEFHRTQTVPSIDAEITHSSTYRIGQSGLLELANYIRSWGYHAQVDASNDPSSLNVPMFVAAGLGQLGACGYLLSPHAGNRMRLMIITTDAKVTYDQPVDFGMHAFCQVCQVCVNRCPGRSLMRDKVWWRGIEKNKLYFRRCRPVMARYMGCAICMKVCPIQKYGMKETLDHYAETGQVLGKGTHDLEGFALPDKGYFGPGEMPVFDPNFFDMPHGSYQQWALEKLRQQVASSGNKITDEMLEEFKQNIVKGLAGKTPVEEALQSGADYI